MKKSLIQELDELENTHWWHKAKRDIFSHYINQYIQKNSKSKVRILELGAGAGNLLAPFKDIAEVMALDPDSSAIEYCKKRGIKQTIKKTLEEYTDYKPGSIDIIIAADVLEHIKDDKRALQKIWGMLKKDGELLIHVPANQALFSYWDKALGHYRRYSKKELVSKLAKEKYSIDRVFHRVVLPYPFVKFFRKIKNVQESKKENISSDFKSFPLLNHVMFALIKIEDYFSKKTSASSPFGLSLFAIARKK